MAAIHDLVYYLSEHPSIVTFRWGHDQWFGSTWPFLFTSIVLYISSALILHSFLFLVFRRRRYFPLGPLPAIHSLGMVLISAGIFAGILLSATAEIRNTRWLWSHHGTTPFQWLLCFPLGTRPSSRVFFWSYAYYLSRFLHALWTFITILRHRRLSFFDLFNHSILIFMSFLWLEFSQSFQVLAILLTTLAYSVVYGYQIILMSCNLICHVAVLVLHYMKGGCHGIEAWGFNSVLNGAILFFFINFYVKMRIRRRKTGKGGAVVDRRRKAIKLELDKDGSSDYGAPF